MNKVYKIASALAFIVMLNINVEAAAEDSIHVRDFTFTGAGSELIDKSDLTNLVKAHLNQDLANEQIDAVANKIAEYYRKKGYPAVSVVQDLQEDHKDGDGIVGFKIVVGRVGDIHIDNQSKLSDGRLRKYLDRHINKNDYIKLHDLETGLIAIDTMQGIESNFELMSGKVPGMTDITLHSKQKPDEKFIFIDNSGAKYTGKNRYGISGSFYNADQNGAYLGYSFLHTNEDMYNTALTYEVPVGTRGDQLGIQAAHQTYSLGDIYSLIGATGISDTYGFYYKQPIIQQIDEQVNLRYSYQHKNLTNRLEVFDIETKKKSNLYSISIEGKHKGARSLAEYNLEYSFGNCTGKEQYQKAVINWKSTQYVKKNLNLLFKFDGQFASRELDSSEQFSLGGPSNIRAYAQGEGVGDSGYCASAELQYYTKIPNLYIAAFFDFGSVTTKSDELSRNLQGAGIGVGYNNPNNYYIRLDYARKINGQPDISEGSNDNGRWWLKFYKIL